jgi:hypothetical protein
MYRYKNSAVMVAQVPFAFLKALDRFVSAKLNAFRDTFRCQPWYSMITVHIYKLVVR